MTIHYLLATHISLNQCSENVGRVQKSIELRIQEIEAEKRQKRVVSNLANTFLVYFKINEHDTRLVSYFTGNEAYIKNNKEAIELWVKAELVEEDCIDVLHMKFKNILSRIDPTVDLSEY
ncbi:hypothetical protein [Colwellia sp. BRX8-9]|uniref:hypothetical protein n=1 Tax=Colwellia sp. BRX8-9 TaxID=2759831 RepID=UPI0015F747F0|nr:hypothetical protein [Colwellia sp. BRX8-9]MBA6349864.1 hypothetical protein [Colwellia sp. BRX8-9]